MSEVNLNEFVMILFDFAFDLDEFDINLSKLHIWAAKSTQKRENDTKKQHQASHTRQNPINRCSL